MIASVAKRMNDKEKGFTLIELLVVVVIIGILAAIAIPQFMKYREGAWEKSVESDVRNTNVDVEGYATSHNGTYPASGDAEGFTVVESTGNEITYTLGGDGKSYTITGTNENLDKTYTFESTDGVGKWSE